jgi:catechol 2,3-dioxygenase
MGAVRLVVADIDRMQSFYETSIGLQPIGSDGDTVSLGVDGRSVVELVNVPGAQTRPHPTTGLFHLAVLVPSRVELARAIQRVVDSGWSFTGASDHLVSEAMYLDDPEGNGIEIYRDRPRQQWRTNGELKMATLPLDIDSIMEEGASKGPATQTMAAGTRIGHVHLQVANIPEAESFYCDLVGFDVMVRSYPGALFVSAGGYHHHIGLNTWASAGARPAEPGTRGLHSFDVTLPSPDAISEIEQRVKEKGLPAIRQGPLLELTDPSGNRVRLAAAFDN